MPTSPESNPNFFNPPPRPSFERKLPDPLPTIEKIAPDETPTPKGQLETRELPESTQTEQEKPKPSKWETFKSLVKATPEIAAALWHDRHSRNQMAETLYTTLSTIGGVKFAGDLLRIPLGLKYGEQAGGDIYRKVMDVKERKATKEAGLNFTEALIQSEAQRKLNQQLKSELLEKKKEELKEKGIDYETLNEEEKDSILNKVKQEARQELKKRLGSDTELELVRQRAQELQVQKEAMLIAAAPEKVRQRAKDIRLELQKNPSSLDTTTKEKLQTELKEIKNKYSQGGRLTAENSSLMQSQINQVYLEYKEKRGGQKEERQAAIKEAVNTFVKDKTSGLRIARDAWNSVITLTGMGLVLPMARGAGYFGFEIAERINKASQTLKQKEAAQQVHKRRRLSNEKEDIQDDHLKAKENYYKNLALETAKEYWRDIKALGLKGRSEESAQLEGKIGTVRRLSEAGQSLGSLARAFSLLSQGLMIEKTGEWSNIPEIIAQKLQEVQQTKGASVFGNFTKNIDSTIHAYQRSLNPETYHQIFDRLKKLGVEEGATFSFGTATAEAATVQAATATPTPTATPSYEEHRVAKGESLWVLAKPVAKESGLSITNIIESIKAENKLSSDVLQPNQLLKIPTAESLLEQATTITGEKIQQLDKFAQEGIGTPYSPQNNCMTFLQNCFRKAGMAFNADDFSYAGKMVKNIGQPVEGATVANIDQLKKHPGQYLIAFGHRYKDSSQGPALETWNHAGYVKVDEQGNISLVHASSNAVKMADNKFYNYNECKQSQGSYYTPSGERLNTVSHEGKSGKPENGWVATEPLEDYLSDVKWTKIALTRLDGEAVRLDSQPQLPIGSEALSGRQQAIIEKLKNEDVYVLDQKKAQRRSQVYRCSADIIQRMRLISRSLPENLHLSLKNGAIVDAPEIEQAILSSGGQVTAQLKNSIRPSHDGPNARLEFLEQYGQESNHYKNGAKEWLRQAGQGKLGLATFLHEGTTIEQMIVRGLPTGGGINSHVVLLLGETTEKIKGAPGQTVAELLQQKYQISPVDFYKSAWAFEALGVKINNEDITTQANWAGQRLTGKEALEIKDIAMNDNVGGKVRHGGVISNFFLKDHTFHPVSVLRPNTAITEKALGSYELPLKVKYVHQVQEGESAADIFKKYKIPPAEQGDMLSYVYAQGVDAKNLRAGAVIAIPHEGELKNNHQLIVEMAEERLDKQSWVRKDEAERNIVVAAGETPQSMMERVVGGKSVSRTEANWLLEQFQQKEAEKEDKDKIFFSENGHLKLKAGDVLRVPLKEVEGLEQTIEKRRQEDKTFAPDQLTLTIKGKEKTVRFSNEDQEIINSVLQKHPQFNGHMAEYLSAILAQEQKRAGGFVRRGWAESAIYKIPGMEWLAPRVASLFQRLPIIGHHIPSGVSSVGVFQVQANELVLKRLQELGDTDIATLPELKIALAHDGQLNSMAAAIMAQDHIDNLQNSLRAFGEKSQPGQESFDLAVINSHNRGLNKTIFGALELRIKDLAIAAGRGDLWQNRFGNKALTGNNSERSPLASTFLELALDLNNRGLLNVPAAQIRYDASQSKTDLTAFLASPTMQAVKEIYPRFSGGKGMSLLATRSDIGRSDFKAWNYASLIAESNVLSQIPKSKKI